MLAEELEAPGGPEDGYSTDSSSSPESTGQTPAFLTQGREPRLPSSLYDMETLGTGRATETPEENANKLRKVFEIVRPSQTL